MDFFKDERLLQELCEDIDECCEIDPFLEEAVVDVDQRVMVLPNGKSLTLKAMAGHIAKQTGWPREDVLSRMVNWLTMDYLPEGEMDEAQMAAFEEKIEAWVQPFEG